MRNNLCLSKVVWKGDSMYMGLTFYHFHPNFKTCKTLKRSRELLQAARQRGTEGLFN